MITVSGCAAPNTPETSLLRSSFTWSCRASASFQSLVPVRPREIHHAHAYEHMWMFSSKRLEPSLLYLNLQLLHLLPPLLILVRHREALHADQRGCGCLAPCKPLLHKAVASRPPSTALEPGTFPRGSLARKGISMFSPLATRNESPILGPPAPPPPPTVLVSGTSTQGRPP